MPRLSYLFRRLCKKWGEGVHAIQAALTVAPLRPLPPTSEPLHRNRGECARILAYTAEFHFPGEGSFMSKVRILLASAAIALIAFGCKSETATASAGTGAVATSSAGTAVAATAPVKKEIVDPSFNNMNAVEVTVPGNWHFQGTLMQGGQCVGTPFPVFRVTSPDGLSAFEREPTLGWRFGTGPMVGNATDCLALKSAIGAQDFLKYLASTMHLTYVSEVPEPAAENAAAQAGLAAAEAVYAPKYAAEHLTPPKNTRVMARARVSYQNGTFPMLGELRVQLDCTESIYPGMKSILQGIPDRPDSDVTQCTAATRFYSAPSAQLTSVLAVWDAPGMGAVALMPWQQAWVNRNQQQANIVMSQMIAATNAAMKAQYQQFQQSMAAQAQMHQQFMAQMQASTDASMANANASMNAQSTAASDWVNYALDQQTVLDPSTGQVSNVSSAYTYTWSNGQTSYQTNDPNANPSGTMPGTWTKTQQVHGNGTPK